MNLVFKGSAWVPGYHLAAGSMFVYPSALIATRIVSVFMSVWFSFFFVDLRCFTSRSETLGPRTTTGVSQRLFSGHFRQVFFNTNALPRINIGADVWGESGIMTGVC